MKKSEKTKNHGKNIQPVIEPAGMRNVGKKGKGPTEEDLREALRWQVEHSQ